MIEWFEKQSKGQWNPNVPQPGEDGMLEALMKVKEEMMKILPPTQYAIQWDWCIPKGNPFSLPGCDFMGRQVPTTFYFHPDDFIPFVQRNFGSMQALDSLKRILHDKIERGYYG